MESRRFRKADLGQPTRLSAILCAEAESSSEENQMNNIIYIIGLIVVIVAVLGFFGLR